MACRNDAGYEQPADLAAVSQASASMEHRARAIEYGTAAIGDTVRHHS